MLPAEAPDAAPDAVPDAALEATRASALATLASNIRTFPEHPGGYSEPVLIEGSTYAGVWMECGPHEALVWAHVAGPRDGTPSPLQVARNNHTGFFALQHPD